MLLTNQFDHGSDDRRAQLSAGGRDSNRWCVRHRECSFVLFGMFVRQFDRLTCAVCALIASALITSELRTKSRSVDPIQVRWRSSGSNCGSERCTREMPSLAGL